MPIAKERITSSAARTVGPVATCARVLRATTDGDDFRGARDRLATVLRQEAVRVLLTTGVPTPVREDIAQAVTLTVLDRIIDGAVEPGFEDGYLAVAAKNRARDWHREASGVFHKTESYDEDLISEGLDPLAALELAEDDEATRLLADRIALALQSAPPRYREALQAVYLDGTPIDVLVDRELLQDWPRSSDDKTLVHGSRGSTEGGTRDEGQDPIAARRRARARIDKLLQRARDWVRARVLAKRSTPPPSPSEVTR